MSQAIGNFVYGVPCTWLMREKARELGLVQPRGCRSEKGDFEALGFTVDYSGNGETPIWCGVVLSDVSEGNNIRLSEIITEPTDGQRAEFVRRFAVLPEVLRDMAGEPAVWLLWSSS